MQLLNYLGIKKVNVLAISAGGPSAIYFAAHFPERIKTLTLQSAVTKEWHTPKDPIYNIAHVLFHPITEKMTWKLTSHLSNLFPTFIFKQMIPSFNKQIKSNFTKRDIDQVRKMNNRQQSSSGFLIDLHQTKEITAKDLQAIECPTLIMHSKYDRAVSVEHATYAHKYISNSKLCILDTWGHLLWIGEGAYNTNKQLVAFLTNLS